MCHLRGLPRTAREGKGSDRGEGDDARSPAPISIAALKRGMNVIVPQPLANRLLEARAVIETARSKKIATHFMPASTGSAGQTQAVAMIKSGDIDTLREIHNWSMRPMWPQFPTLPTDRPAVPGIRLDALAWSSARSAVSPQLYSHQFPRLVRVRRGVDRRHGALQPLAALPTPRPGRTDQRGIDTQPCLHGRWSCSSGSRTITRSRPPARFA